jgi:uncharacterized membrane protein
MTSVKRLKGHTKLLLCAVVGIFAALATGYAGQWSEAPLIGWDAAAVCYLGWVWSSIWRLDAVATGRESEREDPTRVVADLLVLAAATASLLAVGLVVFRAGNSHGLLRGMLIGLAVVSVVLSWAVVHTVYTLRYARLYYGGPDGGVNFNQREAPRFSDFAYLAFTIGMTFQVADTALTSSPFRAAVLRHALLSYLFGTVIVATTINLLVSLSH